MFTTLKKRQSVFSINDRAIYFAEKTPDKPSSAPVESAKPDTPEAKLTEAKKMLDQRIAKVEAYLAGIDPKHPAVIEAKQKLEAVKKQRDPEKDNSRLDKIESIISYFDLHAEFEKRRAVIGRALEENAGTIRADYETGLSRFFATNPDLNPDLKGELTAANRESVQALIDAYNAKYSVKNDVSLADFFKNPAAARNQMDQVSKPPYDLIAAGMLPAIPENETIAQNYEAKKMVILGKDKDASVKEINVRAEKVKSELMANLARIKLAVSLHPERKSELESEYKKVSEKYNQTLALQQNSLALFESFNDPKDPLVAKRRSLVLANFEDEAQKSAGGGADERPNLSSVLALTGQKIDDVAGQLSLLVAGNSPDGVTKAFAGAHEVGQWGTVKGKVDFRMDGNGLSLANQNFNIAVLVDKKYYPVSNPDGSQVTFVKVQVNPPDGPIGLIPLNSIEFSGDKRKTDEKKKDGSESKKAVGGDMGFKEIGTDLNEKGADLNVLEGEFKEARDILRRKTEEAGGADKMSGKIYEYIDKNSDGSVVIPVANKGKAGAGGGNPTPEDLIEAAGEIYAQKNPADGEALRDGEISPQDFMMKILGDMK